MVNSLNGSASSSQAQIANPFQQPRQTDTDDKPSGGAARAARAGQASGTQSATAGRHAEHTAQVAHNGNDAKPKSTVSRGQHVDITV